MILTKSWKAASRSLRNTCSTVALEGSFSASTMRNKGIHFSGTKGFTTVSSLHHQCFQYIHCPSAWTAAPPQSPLMCGYTPPPTFSSRFLLRKGDNM